MLLGTYRKETKYLMKQNAHFFGYNFWLYYCISHIEHHNFSCFSVVINGRGGMCYPLIIFLSVIFSSLKKFLATLFNILHDVLWHSTDVRVVEAACLECSIRICPEYIYCVFLFTQIYFQKTCELCQKSFRESILW